MQLPYWYRAQMLCGDFHLFSLAFKTNSIQIPCNNLCLTQWIRQESIAVSVHGMEIRKRHWKRIYFFYIIQFSDFAKNGSLLYETPIFYLLDLNTKPHSEYFVFLWFDPFYLVDHHEICKTPHPQADKKRSGMFIFTQK